MFGEAYMSQTYSVLHSVDNIDIYFGFMVLYQICDFSWNRVRGYVICQDGTLVQQVRVLPHPLRLSFRH